MRKALLFDLERLPFVAFDAQRVELAELPFEPLALERKLARPVLGVVECTQRRAPVGEGGGH